MLSEIYCKNCTWFAPIESVPAAENMYRKLHELFDGTLSPREGMVGVCRKVTFCAERPVITNENGYCHRAEYKKGVITKEQYTQITGKEY